MLWSTELPETDLFPLGIIPSSLTVAKERFETALPGDKIRASTTNRVYFPVVERVNYLIKFNGNGVKGLKKEVEVPYSSTYVIPHPTGSIPDGLEFLGWSSHKTGNPKTAYQPGQSITMPAADFNLYALWDYDSSSIIYSILVIATVIGIGLISIIISVTSNILIVRLILLVVGLLIIALAVKFYMNRHVFWGSIYLYFALSVLFWGCIPHLYLMMMIISF